MIERAAKMADWLRGTYGFSPEMNAKCVQLLKDMAGEMERLRAERDAAQWISVDERLPDNGEWVLVIGEFTNKKGGWCVPHVAEMRWGKWCAQDEMLPYLDERGFKITHWMPLPEPPEEEE